MNIIIDGKQIEVSPEMNLVQAAKTLGIDIPTLCYKEGMPHFTSCMLCVVKDKTSGRTLPACSARVAEGMEIETESAEIAASRKATLELLLSEHTGDCEAPCQRVCPVGMNIPHMIRHIMERNPREAVMVVRREIAVPSILERYCNAPCEKGCRRSKQDEGLAIRELTRYTSDADLKTDDPYVPPAQPPTGKRIAVVGAGVAGLTAATRLQMEGHACVVYEQKNEVGGRLRKEFPNIPWESEIIEAELAIMTALGVEFRWGVSVGVDLEREQLQQSFDAVVLTMGAKSPDDLKALGLTSKGKGVKVHPKTYITNLEGVFAAGSMLKGGQPVIKSATSAREMAACVNQYVSGLPMTGLSEMFNSSMGRLQDGELETFMVHANPRSRVVPTDAAFDRTEAESECSRCLHCDCRQSEDCKLRVYSDRYGANQRHFKGEQRPTFTHLNQNAAAVYESGKCVKCGLCVRVTKSYGEPYGLTFVGRGFDVRTAVPLDKSLEDGLGEVADLVIDTCPTGALAANEKKVTRK